VSSTIDIIDSDPNNKLLIAVATKQPYLNFLKPKYVFTIFIISIALSLYAATSVDLKKDEIGALVNIYIPIFVGLFTSLTLIILFAFNKNIAVKTALLFVLLNLFTGFYLKISFLPFLNANLITYKHFSSKTDSVSIQNLDGFPATNHLVFSYICSPESKSGKISGEDENLNHNKIAIRIFNNGTKNQLIKNGLFSNNGLWQIEHISNFDKKKSVFPIVVPAKNYVDIFIVFTANSINKRIASVWWKKALRFQYYMTNIGRKIGYQLPAATNCVTVHDSLLLITGARQDSSIKIHLSALWQYHPESDWEPDLQRQLSVLGFRTKVGFRNFDNGSNGDFIIPNSDEIPVSYFKAANAKIPVKIKKLGAYHGCCSIKDADTLNYWGFNQNTPTPILWYDKISGQMLLPKSVNTQNNFALIQPVDVFSLSTGNSYLNRKKNFDKKIGVRVWKAYTSVGLIKNAYIFGSDYLGTKGTNYDYQDNLYYIENVIPLP